MAKSCPVCGNNMTKIKEEKNKDREGQDLVKDPNLRYKKVKRKYDQKTYECTNTAGHPDGNNETWIVDK